MISEQGQDQHYDTHLHLDWGLGELAYVTFLCWHITM